MEEQKKISKLDAFFHISERGSSVKTEVVSGLVTFMTMCYILMVNAGIFSVLPGVSYGAIYVATGISAIVGTVLTGLMANLPFAQASGMGLNAFFVYTICLVLGLSYENALLIVLLDGIFFIICTVTGLRNTIFKAIPAEIRHAIPAGIGLFICLIGLSGTVLQTSNGLPITSMFNFNVLSNAFSGWSQLLTAFVLFVGFLAIGIMSKKKVKGAMLWGILGSAVLYYILGLFVKSGDTTVTAAAFANLNWNPFAAFKDFGNEAFLAVFKKGFDFSAYLANNSVGSLVLLIVTTTFAFSMVDMFDTIGTLYGAASRGNMLDKDGNVPNFNKAMLADAIATCTGAMVGTSTVTTFVESASGIAEGGRTGFTAIITAAGFLVALFLSPIASLIPTAATHAALCYVGVLMMASVKDIDWLDPEKAIPAFVSLTIIVLAYGISKGIGLGIISYVVIKLFLGKAKEVKLTTWILAILFALMMIFTSI